MSEYNNLDWKGLIVLLGNENVEKIKTAITNEIIVNMQESLRNEWFILPSEFEDMFDQLGEEVFEEVKKKYKKELKAIECEKMEEFLSRIKNKVM